VIPDWVVQLTVENGGVRVAGTVDDGAWAHRVAPEDHQATRKAVPRVMGMFESGRRPLADPVELTELGRSTGRTRGRVARKGLIVSEDCHAC